MADDTHVEGPDTPAPLFAIRAFKSMLWGAKPPADATILEPAKQDESAKLPKQQTKVQAKNPSRSPVKPTGILLTPGTATARRKRVSFGRELVDSDTPTSNPASTARVPTPWKPEEIDDAPRPRPRTKLTEALEASRSTKTKPKETQPAQKPAFVDDDPAWEEVDYLDRDPDITIDLNEPHSQSGKYWKSQHHEYRDDAKVEMAKLLRYKQLAKEYARLKDKEALELKEKLKESQENLAAMEARSKRLSAQGVSKRTVAEGPVKTVSPGTEKTLADTREELKRAREQIAELKKLKQELRDSQANARAAEKRVLRLEADKTNLETENRKLDAEAKRLAKAVEKLDAREETLLTEKKKLEAENKKLAKELKAAKLRLETEHKSLDAPREVAKPRQEEAENEREPLAPRMTSASIRSQLTTRSSIKETKTSSRRSAMPVKSIFDSDQRPISSSSEDAGVDLLKERFARLGDQPKPTAVPDIVPDAAPDCSAANWSTANTTLPAGRAAAAMARLAKKREERALRERIERAETKIQPPKDPRRIARNGRREMMKENVRPYGERD